VLEGNRISSDLPGKQAIDIRDKRSIATVFREARPEVVFLLAAHSDIDYCEQHPEDARAVNLYGARHVAEACAAAGAQLIFTSTAAVFDGRQHGYSEESPVNPASIYGETKAEAERQILALLPDAIIVRFALVIGFGLPPFTGAVLDKLKQRWTSGQSVAFPVFEYRNAIDAESTSQFMLELVKKHQRGIFHIGSSDSISRYDLGLRLAARMGYSDSLVSPQREPVPGRAPRGLDYLLLTDKLRAVSTIPVPSVSQAIERCFDGFA